LVLWTTGIFGLRVLLSRRILYSAIAQPSNLRLRLYSLFLRRNCGLEPISDLVTNLVWKTHSFYRFQKYNLFIYYLFICLFVYLFICLFIYLFIYSFIYLFILINLIVYVFIYFKLYQFICASFFFIFINIFINIFIYLFIHLFVFLFMRLCIHLLDLPIDLFYLFIIVIYI
jgi:hypothetical protein